jgi:protein-disulfide isomerase
MAGNQRRTQILAIAAFAAVVVVALIAFSVSGSDDEGSDGGQGIEESAAETTALLKGIPQSGTVLGDPDAPATLVEFADLQCPFCAEFATGTLPAVIEDFVRPGDLALDFQALTFIGPDSEQAARMAEAAGLQDQLWQFVDVFYANQGTENSGYVDEDFLVEIGSAIGDLDAEAALADSDSPEVDAALAAASSLADEFGVDSTPSFVISPKRGEPRRLEVASLDPEEFTAALEAALGNRQ